jgi:hypothetical protein
MLAAAEAIGLLEGMAHAYAQGDELLDSIAAAMEQEILKTEFIAQHHIGRITAHAGRAQGVSGSGRMDSTPPRS